MADVYALRSIQGDQCPHTVKYPDIYHTLRSTPSQVTITHEIFNSIISGQRKVEPQGPHFTIIMKPPLKLPLNMAADSLR